MTTPFPQPDPLVGRVLPDGLRVLERVGTTSEGPLYHALDPGSGRPVALTILRFPPGHRLAGSSSLREDHWLQLRRACQIRHPNVAGLLQVDETPEGLAYAVAELVPGELLSDMLEAGGAVPRVQAVDICLQAAAGLEAAHRVGIVHGALSPQAILVTPGDGARLAVKLVRFDFSGSQRDEAGNPRSADPRYASPERRAGHAPDVGDDVFALGAVLHHLLTGAPPGTRASLQSISQPLRRVVERALAARGPRYVSATALAEALARAAALPAEAPRRRGPRVGWLVAAAALVAAGLWFGWDRYHARGDDLGLDVEARAPDTTADLEPAPAPADSSARAGSSPAADSARRTGASPAPDSALRAGRSPAADSAVRAGSSSTADSAPRARASPAAASVPTADSTPPTPAVSPPVPAKGDSGSGARRSPTSRDTSSGAALSPFRRSHPWAARPDGRIYFRSSCSLAFESPDLVYFRTEAEARATGRSRSAEPGCS